MATLAENVSALATRVGTEIKGVKGTVGTLADLSTDVKTNLVAAINEVDAALTALEGTVASQTNIDDANVSAATTYSSQKIVSEITAAKQAVKDELLGGAGEAYDTLKELGELIDTNKDAIDALEALAAGHVKYDGAQTLTSEQQAQARTNIGAASATDCAAAKAAADAAQAAAEAADAKAVAAQNDVDALELAVGDTTTNFVTAFEAALA